MRRAAASLPAATVEIYEAIYKLAVIVPRFGMKLSPKSKRLPAFIKRQANPGNRPLAMLPAAPPTSVTTASSFVWPNLALPPSSSASVIMRLQSHCAVTVRHAPNLSDLSSISVNRTTALFSQNNAKKLVRSKHAMSKVVKFSQDRNVRVYAT